MDACTAIVAGLDGRGNTIVRRMHCEVPLLVRAVGGPGPILHLAMVNGAAGPLGGDHLHVRLEVEPGAGVSVRSVAAAMAQPDAHGRQSTLSVELVVGARARLDWRPQPMVSVVGSDHRSTMRIHATNSSTVSVVEGVSLGRHGEPCGRFALTERVVIDGETVLDHETAFAPGALLGPGAQGPGRTMSTEVSIGARLPAAVTTVTADRLHATVHVTPSCALAMTRT